MVNRRFYIFFFFAALLLLAAILALTSLSPVSRVAAANRSISLVGFVSAWNYTSVSNPTITVTQGDIVMITLSSGDTMHQFALDVDKDGVKFMGSCPVGDNCSSPFTLSSGTSITITTASLAPGTYTYFCTFHPAMVGSFVVNAPDFGVSSNPPNLSILQGSNANSTITLSSINNFAGTITLSANPSPAGPTTSFGTNPVMVSSGGTATSKLTISIPQTISPGLYSVTVTGTNSSGSPSHPTTISVTVTKPDFSITSSPTSLTVAPGSSGTTSITLTSMNGFSGTLTLSATVSPSGPQVSLNPSSVSVTSGGSAPSTLTISTAASGSYSTPVAQGNYSVNVTASIGSLHHSTPVSLTVSSTSPPPSAPSLPLIAIVGGVIAAIAVAAVAVFLTRRRH